MVTRLSVHPERSHKTVRVVRSRKLKRKTWLAILAGSTLFWMVVALLAWHIFG
ncbi:YmiA family putative membrane protein [Izhakiella capsodis]|uniref:YmiA family putative membrane protein n=1 Tax=Izhakiella capsodis TaxID=1367852 RepID=UPI000B8464B7|nr:YmiA family putative membrane protein [Izhakiella capsodis]